MKIQEVDVPFIDGVVSDLIEIVKCRKEDFETHLSRIASAATEEYIRMMLGEKSFSRGSDIREYRLCLLIQHFFNGRIPDERTISSLFQTTLTESRTLLRSTLAKYHYTLERAVIDSIKDIILSDFNKDDDGNRILINAPDNIIEEMNKRISEIDGTHKPITKQRGSLQVYLIPPATYSSLHKWVMSK